MNKNEESPPKPRKRKLTEVTLNWIADRMRRAEQIKGQIAEGTYKLDSKKIASAILNEDD